MAKAPDYWNDPPRPSLRLLSLLYAGGMWARFALTSPLKLSVPVICIGNVVAGGAGKTPVVIAFAEYLKQQGHVPHILTRGYGGSGSHPMQVTPQHTAAEVGDEALLLARHAPCWVDANRRRSAKLAIRAGANILLMDDGFQNPALEKDISILVIDGGYGFGNGAVLPAGPLRELPTAAYRRAQGIVMTGRDAHHVDSHPAKIIDTITGNDRSPDSGTAQRRETAGVLRYRQAAEILRYVEGCRVERG